MDGAIALLRFWRAYTPEVLLVPELQCFVDRQRPILKINRVSCQTDHLAGTQTRFQNQSVLIVIVGTPRRVKELLLFLSGEEVNVICRADRLCVSNAIHRVLVNQVVHFCSLEHRTHSDVGLTDS